MDSFAAASASERRFMPPAVAVSTVAFALQPPAGAYRIDADDISRRAPGGAGRVADEPGGATTLWIPLVRRTRAPFRGRWALPGGPTRWNETLADTALRSIRAATLHAPGYLEQLYAFGGIERSADAQRLVTIAYWALYGEADLAEGGERREPATAGSAAGGTPGMSGGGRAAGVGPLRRWDDPAPAEGALNEAPDAADVPDAPDALAAPEPRVGELPHDENVAWCSADRLPELAFDHEEIVSYALARLRSKTEYAAVAHRFLGATFTIGQLRAVYEAVLGRAVDPANFRRQMLAQGTLVDTGERETGTPHRPARLYRFREDAARTFPTDRPEPRSTT
ncbi:NUDIX hydrolase [Leucobacter sp. USHLN153]|uniref:NUDIX hydrolase n=1 Tax=Leucobacter sp. USHLN153 TaxID=3081268 RepID=UPI00301790F9